MHKHDHGPAKAAPTGRHWSLEVVRYFLWLCIWFGLSVEMIAYFMYKGKWGNYVDGLGQKDFGFHGALWPGKAKRFRIDIACGCLVMAAMATAFLDELLSWQSHPDLDRHYRLGRALQARFKVCGGKVVHWWLGPDASVAGTVACLLITACVCTWHVVGTAGEFRKRNHDGGPEGQAVPAKVWFGNSNRIGTHRALRTHGLWFGLDAMVTLGLIGIPTARVSAIFRAIGLPYEAAIAYHRWLGHFTILLLTLHFVFYSASFVLIGGGGWNRHGRDELWDQMFETCKERDKYRIGANAPHGFTFFFRNDCTGVSNASGTFAWFVGIFMWMTALPRVRRWSYDLFISTHQLHWLFWFLSCCHYNTIVTYAMPSMVFYVADLAHRRYRTTWPVACGLKFHQGAGSAAMTTLAVPLPPSRAPSRCPMAASCRDAVPDDAAAAVIHLKSYALSMVRRKPFTVAGSFYDSRGRRFGLVHVFDAGGGARTWTAGLCRLAASSDVGHLILRGPLPHPGVEYNAARDAARGKGTLLLGAGSGQTPAIAFLRKVRDFRAANAAHGMEVASEAPNVRFVLVVRDPVLIECCEAWMLPRDADGATGVPWLATEIHVTRTGDAGKAALEVIPDVDDALTGPVEVVRDADGGLIGVASSWPVPPPAGEDPSKDPEAATTLEEEGRAATFCPDEAWALLGALLGYVFTGQGLAWQKHGPLDEEFTQSLLQPKRAGNPNVVSGGFLFVFCCLAALVGALLFLALADLGRAAIAAARGHGHVRRQVDGQAATPRSACVRIALAGDGKRPDLAEVVARADADFGTDAQVLGGGPSGLLERLNLQIGSRIMHRLTYAM